MLTPELNTGRLEDTHVLDTFPLLAPNEVKQLLPLKRPEIVTNVRRGIEDILRGKDHRKLVITGPCSIHDPVSALEYAQQLREIQDETSNELLIVMRTYFEKPRTTVGWKGLIHDPYLDGSEDFQRGLLLAREILVRINELGIPCATEILDPNTPQYLADGISWGAIGARTVESQIHRQVASGMSMPIGMKNGTWGDISVAINAMHAARKPHSFPGVNGQGLLSMVKTTGNPNTHIVLRGGANGSNFDPETIENTRVALAEQFGLINGVLIDCSHGNSNKDHNNQPRVLSEVARQIRGGQQGILGIMLESNILGGNQKWDPTVRPANGLSITDACIDIQITRGVIHGFAQAL
ncbi:MAG: hypothetical protein ACD_37C00076G0008 [uncultured bacterium]|nr:MAG: hypothetical protein ACD_37C00076G0008 [uncultured bacterium]